MGFKPYPMPNPLTWKRKPLTRKYFRLMHFKPYSMPNPFNLEKRTFDPNFFFETLRGCVLLLPHCTDRPSTLPPHATATKGRCSEDTATHVAICPRSRRPTRATNRPTRAANRSDGERPLGSCYGHGCYDYVRKTCVCVERVKWSVLAKG